MYQTSSFRATISQKSNYLIRHYAISGFGWTYLYLHYSIRAYRTPHLIKTPWGTFQAQHGHFVDFLSKVMVFFNKKWAKPTIVSKLKIVKIKRTLEFYRCGLGCSLDMYFFSFRWSISDKIKVFLCIQGVTTNF